MVVETRDAAGSKAEVCLELHPEAQFLLDGLPSNRADALKEGREVTVYPARGPTVIVFPPVAEP